MSRNTLIIILASLLFIPVIFSGLMWLNLRLATINPQDTHFITYWLGTRSFLFDAESPYSEDVTEQIQQGIYGHPIKAGEHAFTVRYPLYAVLLFAPFALVSDYLVARALWLTGLQVVLIVTAVLAARLVDWKPPLWLFIPSLLFSLLWVHGFLPMIDGNVIIWVAFFLVLTLLSIRAERYEVAGILLALLTFQPLPVLPVIVFIIFWSFSHRQWLLPVFFACILALLTAAGMFVIPDWPVEFLRVLLNSSEYPPPDTLGLVLADWWPGVGLQLGWAIVAFFVVILLSEWWLARHKDFRWFLWTCCLTLVIGQWVGIPTSPVVFTLFILPLMLVFATWEERNSFGSRILAIIILLVMGGGLWSIFWSGRDDYPWPLAPAGLFIPAPLLVLFMLYWIRWWAIRPRRLFEKLRSSGVL